MHHSSTTPHRIAIIGAGFGGIGAAIRLRQRGETNFVIFDKAEGIGGTWWVNRYPGCACDVPSHLYSFSFAPNPDWTRRFSPREEIQAYLEGLVKEHDLDSHLQLGTEIIQARWQQDSHRWLLRDQRGRSRTASVLVTALGGLSRPAWPDIEGLDSFAGRVMHSQLWDASWDAADQRVAVIGTGASAVQFIPHVAGKAASLKVFQRTPNWIIPRPDRAIGPRWRALYRRFPWLQKLARFGIWAVSEMRVPALMWVRSLATGHRWLAHWHRWRQVQDPTLREKLKPDYDIGCKRVLLSSDYYPALNEDHVELITDAIECILPDAVIDASGARHEIDTLVLATGFRATDPVPEGMITGRGRLDLARTWRDAPQAYKGTTVAGFPNLFMLLGPNTALGHNSVIMMIESQIHYLCLALEHMKAHGIDALEVDDGHQDWWNGEIQRRLAGSVWNDGGCRSWYLHPDTGRNTTIWPGFTLGFRRRLGRFDSDAYRPTPSR